MVNLCKSGSFAAASHSLRLLLQDFMTEPRSYPQNSMQLSVTAFVKNIEYPSILLLVLLVKVLAIFRLEPVQSAQWLSTDFRIDGSKIDFLMDAPQKPPVTSAACYLSDHPVWLGAQVQSKHGALQILQLCKRELEHHTLMVEGPIKVTCP